MLVPFTVKVCWVESLFTTLRVSFAVADMHAGENARFWMSTSVPFVGASQVGEPPPPVLHATPSAACATTAPITMIRRIRPWSLRNRHSGSPPRLRGVDADRSLLVAFLDLTSRRGGEESAGRAGLRRR